MCPPILLQYACQKLTHAPQPSAYIQSHGCAPSKSEKHTINEPVVALAAAASAVAGAGAAAGAAAVAPE